MTSARAGGGATIRQCIEASERRPIRSALSTDLWVTRAISAAYRKDKAPAEAVYWRVPRATAHGRFGDGLFRDFEPVGRNLPADHSAGVAPSAPR